MQMHASKCCIGLYYHVLFNYTDAITCKQRYVLAGHGEPDFKYFVHYWVLKSIEMGYIYKPITDH